MYTVLSSVFPWTRRNVPLQVPDREGVDLKGELPYFCLFLSITVMLSSGLLSLVVSVNTIIWKSERALLTSTGEEDELMVAAILSSVSSVLALSCCYFAWIIHNDAVVSKRLLIVLIADVVLTGSGLAAAAHMSIVYRSGIKLIPGKERIGLSFSTPNKQVFVLDSAFRRALNATMAREMAYYDTNPSSKDAWDKLQSESRCCGIEGYRDWLILRENDSLPLSCCPKSISKHECFNERSFNYGCVHELGTNLALRASAVSGFSLVTQCFMVGTLFLAVCMYINVTCTKPEDQTATSVNSQLKVQIPEEEANMQETAL
ncbi:uncharacterized protein [Periplaneta americana]|uniref:uncharacterized protein isoform X1 n=1 Tax=Periplaneta americana TaxID=6978 RepID=UPI0037E98C26